MEHRGSEFGVMRLKMSFACCLCSWSDASVYATQSIPQSDPTVQEGDARASPVRRRPSPPAAVRLQP